MTTGEVKGRNSSIELLRMLAGMAVIVLHFNFNPSGGGAVENTTGVIRDFLLLLEIICVSAVNIFILISGYFGVNSSQINVARLTKLLIQTSIFGFGMKAFSCVYSGGWNLKELLYSLVPINYYVILYITLMFISPFVNIILNNISEKGMRLFLIISISFFSLYATFVDVIEEYLGIKLSGLNSISAGGSGAGYTIVNFVLMYIVGGYIRKRELIDRIKARYCIIAECICVCMIWLWRFFFPGTAWIYCNIFVIVEATAIFILFAKLDIRSKAINILAQASFVCYLIQGNILQFIGDHYVIGKSFFEVIGILLFVVLVIYMLAFVIMEIWNLCVRKIYEFTVDKIPNIVIK